MNAEKMSPVSPGSRLSAKQPSHIQFNSLESPATRSEIKLLHTLVKSSFGPHGCLKVIHNNSGGHVLLTSSSSRIFGGLALKNPILRLIVTSLESFRRSFPDGGLFTAIMALKLIEGALDISLHRKLVCEIYEYLLEESIEFLQKDERLELDFSNVKQLEKLVMGVLGTKRCCDLQPPEIASLAQVLTEAFILTFDPQSNGLPRSKLNFVSLKGRPPSESHLVHGVLFRVPHFYQQSALHLMYNDSSAIKVALFNVSMAGDSEEACDVTHEVSEEVDYEQATLAAMEKLIENLLKDSVSVVLCQKVVHPVIKRHLCRHHVLVVERLGSQYINAVKCLSGGELISSFSLRDVSDMYGRLTAVNHVSLDGKRFLHLKNNSSSVASLVLCNHSEQSLEEMKLVCQDAYDLLMMAMFNPYVLAGGGCWQTSLARHLHRSMENGCLMAGKLSELQLSKHQLEMVNRIFCKALEELAMFTLESRHVVERSGQQWSDDLTCSTQPSSQTCARGDTDITGGTVEPETFGTGSIVKSLSHTNVIDLFEIGVNGLKTAVATAIMVLGIQNFVCDTN